MKSKFEPKESGKLCCTKFLKALKSKIKKRKMEKRSAMVLQSKISIYSAFERNLA